MPLWTHPPDIREGLGQTVKELRLDRKLTVRELAASSRLSPSVVSGVELGRRNPTLETVCRLAHALGIGPGWLLARAEGKAAVAAER